MKMSEKQLELLELIIGYLRASQPEKYINFSNYLYEIVDLSYQSEELYSRKVVLRMQGAGMVPSQSLTNEFKQTQKKHEKVCKIMARKLRGIKKIRDFIAMDLECVMSKLKEVNLTPESSSQDIANFFDSCEELQFLNSKKVSKKLK